MFCGVLKFFLHRPRVHEPVCIMAEKEKRNKVDWQTVTDFDTEAEACEFAKTHGVSFKDSPSDTNYQ